MVRENREKGGEEGPVWRGRRRGREEWECRPHVHF